jgi:tRNA (mo5U34)-methyltransferase
MRQWSPVPTFSPMRLAWWRSSLVACGAGPSCYKAAPMSLSERVKETRWYHTLELAPGVVTQGMFDLRGQVDQYGLPAQMDGLRALDVGTFDGFWAFEMERRGASVMSLDLDDEAELDWPPRRRPQSFPEVPRGHGFQIAREIYDSSVERVNLSIYQATPEEIGTFDFVFCGSVLIHLRDQLLALEREKAVVFWQPSARTWRHMIRSAGFDHVEQVRKFKLKAREGWSVPHVVHRCRKRR